MTSVPVLALMSAMEGELKAVLPHLALAGCERVAGRDFWLGQWHGQPVVAVLSRIGKVAAATTATVLAERFGVQNLVFTGVAGGLGPGVQVGDVVVAQQLLQHDLDVSPLFPRYEVPLYGCSHFATDPVLTQRVCRSVQGLLQDFGRLLGPQAVAEFGLTQPRLHTGLIISGDRFVATTAESQALQQALPDALAVEMEGAAVAQVCRDYGIAFAAVRSISDRADDAAHHDFNRFLQMIASRYTQVIFDDCMRGFGANVAA